MRYFLVTSSGTKWRASYDTERGAKIACTRLNKKMASANRFLPYSVMSAEDYVKKFPVKMVERTNLLSGKKFMEAEDTPNFCSPASETYWSM
tara:strand:- start:490 stop:765 length:276 start_codon:yes stop_codon:yes gene_type:complete